MGTAVPCAARSRSRAPITSRSRLRVSITTSTVITWPGFSASSIRYRSTGGAYTDPINPLFNAFSPQPLYSFATGFTHVFFFATGQLLQSGVFVVREPTGPANLAQTLAAFPIVLAGAGGSAPFSPLGGLDNTSGFTSGGEQRDSSSTTILPGARARTSFASALMRAFSG